MDLICLIDQTPLVLLLYISTILKCPDTYMTCCRLWRKLGVYILSDVFISQYKIKVQKSFLTLQSKFILVTYTLFRNKKHSFNDEPSARYRNGTKVWHKNGVIYRDGDKPTVEYVDRLRSRSMWHKDNVLHRDDDKPALVYNVGTKIWYKNGVIHRDGDRPAIKCINGTLKWYRNGVLHRDGDLPAIVYFDGRLEYYKDGCIVSQS
jgi:hypothetical protein